MEIHKFLISIGGRGYGLQKYFWLTNDKMCIEISNILKLYQAAVGIQKWTRLLQTDPRK